MSTTRPRILQDKIDCIWSRNRVNSSTFKGRPNSTGNLLSINSVEFSFLQNSWKIWLPSIEVHHSGILFPLNLWKTSFHYIVDKYSTNSVEFSFPQNSLKQYSSGIWFSISRWIHSKTLTENAVWPTVFIYKKSLYLCTVHLFFFFCSHQLHFFFSLGE